MAGCIDETPASSVVQQTLTNPPKLEDLMNLVAAAEKDKWNEVGIQLGSNLAELNILGSNDNSGKYFQSIFSNWRSSGRKVYKWKVLIDILASQGVDEGRLADELRRRFREDDEPKVQDLMNSVAANARAKWRRIAEQLGMTADEIDAFSPRVVPDYHQCYMTVFANWRNRAKPPDMPYTWEHLIGVLKAIPCVNTAQTLERMLKAPGKCLQATGQSIAASTFQYSTPQLLLSEHIRQVVPQLNGTPTMPTLLSFSDAIRNIAVQIGARYSLFGIILLEDNNGTIVEALEIEHLKIPERINTAILQRWLQGMGTRPVTWLTLVTVLQKMGM